MSWFNVEDGLAAMVDAELHAGGPMTLTAQSVIERQRLEELFGPRPAPAPLEAGSPRRRVWVVMQASGGRLRVLAERHATTPRPDGTELRFYDGSGDDERRVATVRAGSWHWCVAESALDPSADGRKASS